MAIMHAKHAQAFASKVVTVHVLTETVAFYDSALFDTFPPASLHVFCHFALQISISSGEGVGEHA